MDFHLRQEEESSLEKNHTNGLSLSENSIQTFYKRNYCYSETKFYLNTDFLSRN